MSPRDWPGGDPRGPQAIAEQAETCLRSTSYLALRTIACEYREGVLVLRGCLPTYYLKQVAQQVAQEAVVGLEGARIDNQIAVLGSVRASVPGRMPPPDRPATSPHAGHGGAGLIPGRGRR